MWSPTRTKANAPSPSDPLFSPTLIPDSTAKSLPPGYSIRPLSRTDHSSGFLSVLAVLTTVGDISPSSFQSQYDWMASAGKGTYYILVIENEKKEVVGTGAVLVERKFIHELGKVGHIEDIAVRKDQQGKKLGLRIIEALDKLAEGVGCYKVSRNKVFICR